MSCVALPETYWRSLQAQSAQIEGQLLQIINYNQRIANRNLGNELNQAISRF
jgi:hypothetical protein